MSKNQQLKGIYIKQIGEMVHQENLPKDQLNELCQSYQKYSKIW